MEMVCIDSDMPLRTELLLLLRHAKHDVDLNHVKVQDIQHKIQFAI